jgi:hypothetical protein
LALDLHDTAVGPAGAAGVLEDFLLNDACAKALGGAAQRLGIKLVLRMGA